ncbi:hypothetical protein HDU76_000931, partial [Blyttiomyces sp. JEL0837]
LISNSLRFWYVNLVERLLAMGLGTNEFLRSEGIAICEQSGLLAPTAVIREFLIDKVGIDIPKIGGILFGYSNPKEWLKDVHEVGAKCKGCGHYHPAGQVHAKEREINAAKPIVSSFSSNWSFGGFGGDGGSGGGGANGVGGFAIPEGKQNQVQSDDVSPSDMVFKFGGGKGKETVFGGGSGFRFAPFDGTESTDSRSTSVRSRPPLAGSTRGRRPVPTVANKSHRPPAKKI